MKVVDMTKELRNERQAFKALAREAAAAEVRRMADGTLACCGRSGQLAEPIEYDDGSENSVERPQWGLLSNLPHGDED